MWVKEKSSNCDRFSMDPTLILLEHSEKTKTNEFDFILLDLSFFCIQNVFFVNAD